MVIKYIFKIDLDALLSQSNPPLRQRRQRTNFNEEAIVQLEEIFAANPYPDINEREQMARRLRTTEDRVQVWFQNKRARYRKRMSKENKSRPHADASEKQSIKEQKVTPSKGDLWMDNITKAYTFSSTPVLASNYKFNNRASTSNGNESGYLSSACLSHSLDQSGLFTTSPMTMPYNGMYMYNSTPLHALNQNSSCGSSGLCGSFNYLPGMGSFYTDSSLVNYSSIGSPQVSFVAKSNRIPKSIFRPFWFFCYECLILVLYKIVFFVTY